MTPTETVAADDEGHWAGVAAQYAVSDDFINLENGYFGVQAQAVHEAFKRYETEVNRENSYFLRVRYPDLLARVMEALAAFTGADASELLITRNLMESLNILIQGYPFKAGDGVVLAEHDYDSVADTLEMIGQRRDLTLTRVAVPLDPDSDEQIVALYENAITPRARVLLLTHMVHRTGQIMPVAKIAAMARRRGIDVMVDAAHSFAQLDYKLPDLGADFVGVNLHKWLGAPLGVGLLYIRKERIADIAPLFGDTRSDAGDIGKLGHVGTVPPAPILALQDALAFHLKIGSRNKEARLRYLTQYWLAQVRQLPRVLICTPRAPARSCAIAVFGIAGMPAQQIVDQLMARHRIFTVVRQIPGGEGVRVTPHLFTTTAQLDLLVAAIKEMAEADLPIAPEGAATDAAQAVRHFALRDYTPDDAAALDQLALAAFAQFKDDYDDWPGFRAKIASMSALSKHGEIILAEQDGRLLGAVGYIGPHQPKSDFFEPAWPIMRMLVVAPEARGLGLGRALAEACLGRARRDRAAVFALHTSELMSVALPMYERMGFTWRCAAPVLHGVPYAIYVKELDSTL